MDKLCDLHVHSVFSDGTCTPEQLLELAESAGLSAIALCDHNTVAGLPSFLEAAKGGKVEAIPGIEFSTEYLGKELHILGMFITQEHYGAITKRLDELLVQKEKSNIALVEALCQAGLPMDYEQIKERTPDGYVNRALIAAEMVRLGYCNTVKEAFSNWLSPKHGYYCPPQRPLAYDTIRFIKSIGGVAVLAHPFLNLTEEELRQFLPQAITSGLDAMEVYYPMYDASQTVLACDIAKEFGIAFSGGSDFHGTNKPHIAIGKGTGDLAVPMQVLDTLRGFANKQ